MRARQSLMPELPLNEAEAANAVAIYNRFRLPDVIGQPPLGEAGEDWFREIIAALFGSIEGEGAAAIRRVPEIFVLVPKKNSKTTNGAALMMTALLMNERPEAEFLLFGPTHDIAHLAFDQAAGMIRADPSGWLQNRFLVREHLKTIEDQASGATLKIKTFDSKVATGVKPAGVLIDEVHELSRFSYADRVMAQIRGGLAARPEGFLVQITTQSDEPPRGLFKSELKMARAIRDGLVTGEAANMLPILYEFPEDMQMAKGAPWRDPENWGMVLPNLGKPVTIEWMRGKYAEAIEKGPEHERLWASQHLNVQIGLALHSERWTAADYWESRAQPGLTLETLLARCEVAVIGIDAGGSDDLLGLCVAGREKGTGIWLYWFRAWVHPRALELRKDIASVLRDFEDDGDLIITSEVDQDLRELVALVEQVRDSGLMPDAGGVGIDALGLPQLESALRAADFSEPQVVLVGQGYRLTSAVLAMDRALRDGQAAHGGQPIAGWCMSNCKEIRRGSAAYIDKKNEGNAKIDLMIAALNATKLLEVEPVAGRGKASVYEKRDLVILG